eukprot:1286961-Alexandrium_andersonii.AAC.1
MVSALRTRQNVQRAAPECPRWCTRCAGGAMDYCFLAKDTSGATLTALVVKDRDSRATLARPVLREGRLRDDAVDQA